MKRTIPLLLRQAVEQVPDKTWLLASDGGRFTYGQALVLTHEVTEWLVR